MVKNDIFILCDFSFSGPDPSVGEHKGVWGCRGSFGGRSRVRGCFFPNCYILSLLWVLLLKHLIIASERSERSEHTVVLSLNFLSIYIYSVTKILRKIRVITFTENYSREGDE